MKLEFTAKDFYVCDQVVDGKECFKEHEIHLSDKECAEVANARLAEMLAECQEVYGFRDDGCDWGWYPLRHHAFFEKRYTHKARLVGIEELKNGETNERSQN